MLVNIRNYPRLLREFIPLYSLKKGNISSADAMSVLREKFDITCTIEPHTTFLNMEVDDETAIWLSLKWS